MIPIHARLFPMHKLMQELFDLRRITDGVSCTCAFWRSGDQNAAPMFHSIHHLSQTECTQTHSHKQLTQNILLPHSQEAQCLNQDFEKKGTEIYFKSIFVSSIISNIHWQHII
jgi:hypothetical protein